MSKDKKVKVLPGIIKVKIKTEPEEAEVGLIKKSKRFRDSFITPTPHKRSWHWDTNENYFCS